jgi:hypothetical protein
MFRVLVLICSVNMPPGDCQAYNAVEVIRGPEAANEVACGIEVQFFLAQHPSALIRAGEYLKIQCVRTTIGKSVG